MALYAYVVFLSTIIVISESTRILAVFPTPFYSHQFVFRPLTSALAKRGHDVTIITPFPAFSNGTAPENFTEISLENVIRTLSQKIRHGEFRAAKDIYTQQMIVFDALRDLYDGMLLELKDFIHSGQQFDLIMGEACTRFAIVFSVIFKAPFVQVSSYGGTFDTFNIVGAPIHPLLYPLSIREKFNDLTMMDKIYEMYEHYRLIKLYNDAEEAENEVTRRHLGANFPDFKELVRNIEMILLNVHPIWDNNRPVPPNLVYLGGLHLQQQKELPKDLKAQLEASNGAIYMSFGSTVKSSILSQAKIDMFLNVLSKLPYSVFWKWDMAVKNIPDNVIVRKWFPQADLLRHPKIKLFITQGGLQSIDEAIDAMVPMVGVPILWDQWYNVDKIVAFQIGVMCNIHTANAVDFRKAIDTVLNDQSYRINIKNLRDVMNDQPQTSLQRAVWWIEHVIRHKGGKYLKSPAFNMSAIDYFEVHLVLSVAAVILALVLVFIKVIKYFLNIFIVSKVKKD